MKRIVFLFSAAAILAGCQTANVKPDPSVLRVGVSPRSQPMVFKQDGQIVGVEADFAHKLGEALNRKVVFVEVPWEKQIDWLEQNKTDIIMSNVTITAPRRIRVNFTTPYMRSGLSGLFRRDNYDASGLVGSIIRNQNKRIGFVKSTTSEYFCRQRFPRSKQIGYATAEDAVAALKRKKVDMFIHDAPVIWWLSAMNESDLAAFPDVLNAEPLAWCVRKGDAGLLGQINTLLAEWEADGTTREILKNWIPILTQ